MVHFRSTNLAATAGKVVLHNRANYLHYTFLMQRSSRERTSMFGSGAAEFFSENARLLSRTASQHFVLHFVVLRRAVGFGLWTLDFGLWTLDQCVGSHFDQI